MSNNNTSINVTNTRATAESTMNLKSELENAFKSAQSVDEMLETFENVASDSRFNQSELLAEHCWSITHTLLQLTPPHNDQQVFSFGKTALTLLNNQNYSGNIACFGFLPNKIEIDYTRKHPPSLFLACVYYLLGTACYGLMRYEQSLRYLDFSDTIASNLEKDDNSRRRCLKNCVLHTLIATQQQLYNVKVAMGKKDEAVVHLRQVLNFMESIMDENCIELGDMYIEAYEACVEAKDAKQALPLCLKALEIYSKHPIWKSWEIVTLRVDLAVLYYVVGEYDKAAEQDQIWRSVLTYTEDCGDDLFKAELDSATMLIGLGRSDKAIEDLKLKVSRNDTDRNGKASLYVIMARASNILENFIQAKEYIVAAETILEENGMDPIFVGIEYMNMSELYEKVSDFATAMSLLKRVWEKLEPHQKILEESLEKPEHDEDIPEEIRGKLGSLNIFLAKCSSRLFSLISLAGREKEEIPYMISVVEKLQQTFGFKHIEVGYNCAKLGAALMNSGLADLAVQYIESAKDIMDVLLGRHHMESLRTSHTLSETYEKLGRYDEAIKNQVEVIEGLKDLGPSEQQFMDKAVRLLNKMKENSESPTAAGASSQSQDGKDLSAPLSKCGISDDGIRRT